MTGTGDTPPGGGGSDARAVGPALESHDRFLLWPVPAVERFPRGRKFLLGDRIQVAALDVLDALIEATCTRRRSGRLARANLGIEKLRYFPAIDRAILKRDIRRRLACPRALAERSGDPRFPGGRRFGSRGPPSRRRGWARR